MCDSKPRRRTLAGIAIRSGLDKAGLAKMVAALIGLVAGAPVARICAIATRCSMSLLIELSRQASSWRNRIAATERAANRTSDRVRRAVVYSEFFGRPLSYQPC
jgi:hypothetical protein